MRCLMFTYQTTHAYFIYRVLIPYHYQENSFMSWILKALVIFAFPLLLYAHCVTSGTKSIAFKRRREVEFMNFKEKVRYHLCEKCGHDHSWKPFRTKHCKVQQADVTRFDHFCPVTMNTIGHRNHSAFWSTSVNHFFWSGVWIFLYYSYLMNEVIPADKYESSTIHVLTLIGTVLDNLFMAMIFCMACGISTSHTYNAAINQTTLDQLSAPPTKDFSFCKRVFGSFNYGCMYNLRQFFPSPLWLFWFPQPNTSKYEGYYFPQLGIPRELFAFKAQKMDFQYIEQKQVKLRDEELRDAGNYLYFGKKFKFGDKIVTV